MTISPSKFSTTPFAGLFLEQLDDGRVRLFRTDGEQVGTYANAEEALTVAKKIAAPKPPQVNKVYSATINKKGVTITRRKMEG